MTYRMMFTILAAFTMASPAFGAEPQSRELKQSYLAEDVNRLEIELPPDTTLRLRTSTSKQIEVDGKVTVRFEGSPSRLKRQSIMEGLGIAAEMKGNRVRIYDSRDGDARSGWARRLDTNFDLTITVPEWTHVEVRQRNGEVDARGAFGNVDVGMRAGTIALTVPKARVRELTAKTRIGEVKADYGRVTEQMEGLFPGEARYENPDGLTRITLTLTTGEINVKLEEAR